MNSVMSRQCECIQYLNPEMGVIFIVSLIIIRNLNIRCFAALHIVPFAVLRRRLYYIEKGDDIKDLTQIEPFTLTIQEKFRGWNAGLISNRYIFNQ